ncbi:MAG TPA: universal stress protein [Lacipirellulaceae bacterium]|nr:universal stress protein [Lacipirellulaceae bacterium]
MNTNRILLPTDLSACSLVAFDYASELASSSGAELHILYVDDLRNLIALAPYTAPNFVVSCARTQLKERLQTIKPALADVRCEYHYIEGTPADEICAFVERERIDLVVMSSHGRTGLSRVFLGSVAELVLRKAKCPVLIVKQPHQDHEITEPAGADRTSEAPVANPVAAITQTQETVRTVRRILVPYDFSEGSAAALDYAAQFAAKRARLYILHVDELLDAHISAFPPSDSPFLHDSSWDKRRRKIKRQLAKVVPHGAAAVYEHHCLIGAPADEILAFAERVHIDLIVMGSHGRTGLSRLVTGSVAEQVMRRSKCPVLVCKGQPKPVALPPKRLAGSPAFHFGEDFAV